MSYLQLKDYYERCLADHGPTHLGVDWPNPEGMETRYKVMASLIDWADAPVHVLDVGCGPGFFLDYQHKPASPPKLRYRGDDISPAMIAAAQARHPQAAFEARDLMEDPLEEASVDYAVFNGVFTVRQDMSEQDAFDFTARLLSAVFLACRRGLAVNFMAPHADYRDDSLFYLAFDEAAQLFKAKLSRHFRFRSDYGLWEYTAYVYRAPTGSL
ncbi:MAG: class I SAM-dependent methyltransferase [Sphingomonadales bacterium]